MLEYVSTNVRLPKDQIKLLKLRAVEEGKSLGQVFREAVARFLGQGSSQKELRENSKEIKSSPFSGIIGMGSSGMTDGATNHDKYLYGKSKTQWKG